MFKELPLFPEQASTHAERVDNLFFFIAAVTGAVALLVTVLVIYFAVRYRRRSDSPPTPRIMGSVWLETFWSVVPFLIFLIMFGSGCAGLLLANATPRGRAGGLRRRQAVDVEGSASRKDSVRSTNCTSPWAGRSS